jgi:hypothetical protein
MGCGSTIRKVSNVVSVAPAPSTLLLSLYKPIFSDKYFYSEFDVLKTISSTDVYELLK